VTAIQLVSIPKTVVRDEFTPAHTRFDHTSILPSDRSWCRSAATPRGPAGRTKPRSAPGASREFGSPARPRVATSSANARGPRRWPPCSRYGSRGWGSARPPHRYPRDRSHNLDAG
jgi:hypothetical protein